MVRTSSIATSTCLTSAQRPQMSNGAPCRSQDDSSTDFVPDIVGEEFLPEIASHDCQTRIGIGAPRIRCKAIGLILESEVTVIIDQYQCVKTDLSISEV